MTHPSLQPVEMAHASTNGVAEMPQFCATQADSDDEVSDTEMLRAVLQVEAAEAVREAAQAQGKIATTVPSSPPVLAPPTQLLTPSGAPSPSSSKAASFIVFVEDDSNDGYGDQFGVRIHPTAVPHEIYEAIRAELLYQEHAKQAEMFTLLCHGEILECKDGPFLWDDRDCFELRWDCGAPPSFSSSRQVEGQRLFGTGGSERLAMLWTPPCASTPANVHTGFVQDPSVDEDPIDATQALKDM